MDYADMQWALNQSTDESVRRYSSDAMRPAWVQIAPHLKSTADVILLCGECNEAARWARDYRGLAPKKATPEYLASLEGCASLLHGTLVDIPLRSRDRTEQPLSAWIRDVLETERELSGTKPMLERARSAREIEQLRYFVVRLHRYLEKAKIVDGRMPGTLARFATVAMGTTVERGQVLTLLRHE